MDSGCEVVWNGSCVTMTWEWVIIMHVCSLCSVLELGRAKMKKLASFSPHHFTVEGTEIKETKKYPDVLFPKHPLYP